MIFKPMKPEDVLKALSGHKDIVTPAIEAARSFIRNKSCPSCGGSVAEVVNSKTPFKEGSIVPNFLAECGACKIQFEPHTGIQVSMPRPEID